MKNCLIAFVFSLFIALESNAKELVHPFHTSVTECVYNEKEKTWEIAIRLFQDDLELGLSAFHSKKISFEKTPNMDELLESYIRKHFGFQVNKQLQTPYRWIGWEPNPDVIWVYLEIPTDQDLAGVFIMNDLLIEQFPDQTNLFHCARGSKKKSFLFQKNQVLHTLVW
ncbi:DUF6702 family protein [Aquirufa rosea]|uniref:Uncharacterized protein n=1 Tax=Aquirufa rosea TaxID=2509241 RepID=A0A4Q1BYF6_9BACT|nr:DUF6702 family protein [Aquirufa rosea]RXK48091.1 hypothetical protein ESB04_08560 [Aquirufa rosea]